MDIVFGLAWYRMLATRKLPTKATINELVAALVPAAA
jgi:hypothetical protein